MNSTSKEGKRGPWIVSLAVLLALIGGFFLGSRFSFFPQDPTDSSDGDGEWYYGEVQLQVWVSKDKFFIWGHEAPRRLEELPARIKEHTAKRLSNVVHLSAEDLTRFEDMIYALDIFRKAGFTHISVETRPRPMPAPKGK